MDSLPKPLRFRKAYLLIIDPLHISERSKKSINLVLDRWIEQYSIDTQRSELQ